jgi:hypothetical protein
MTLSFGVILALAGTRTIEACPRCVASFIESAEGGLKDYPKIVANPLCEARLVREFLIFPVCAYSLANVIGLEPGRMDA